MKKKKSGGGGANWMDTYGDMVTLLLCFFVLLYSMSTIDEAKWKAIVQSFNPLAVQTETDPSGKGGPFADPDVGDKNPGMSEIDENAQKQINDMMEDLYEAIQSMVSEEGMESTIQVEMNGGKVYVSFSNSVFFTGDSWVLQESGQEVLAKICVLLDDAKDAIDEICVQGHTALYTPNKPNEPRGDYRLSANRAIEVVLFLEDHSSIHPARMSPQGFGQWRPIGDNKDEAGRAPNRRVEMIISGVDLNAEELNEALNQYVTKSDESLHSQGTTP